MMILVTGEEKQRAREPARTFLGQTPLGCIILIVFNVQPHQIIPRGCRREFGKMMPAAEVFLSV